MTGFVEGASPFQLTYLAVAAAVAIVAALRGLWSPCGLSMVSAVNQMSERSRGNRYWLTAGWFIAGAIGGGAALGGVAALGAVALTPLAGMPTLTAAVAAFCAVTALSSDSAVLPYRLPLHPRQVNERWLGRYRRWVYAAGFGAQIGSGFATYIMTAAVYLTVALGVLSASPLVAFGAGLVFGFVRGLGVLPGAWVDNPAALRVLHRRLDDLAPWSLRAAMGVEAIAAVVLAYLAGGRFAGGAVMAILVAAALLCRHRPPRRSSQRTVERSMVAVDS